MKPPQNNTARNILSLLGKTPVIVLKKSTGRKDQETIIREIQARNGEGFRVFDSEEGICIIAEGHASTFLV